MTQVTVFKKIDEADINVRPFVTNKLWRFTNTDYSSSYAISILDAIYPIQTKYYSNRLPLSSSLMVDTEPTNSDGSYKKIIWESLRHLYYNNGQPYDHFGITDETIIHKGLYASASVLSIPQSIYGESIEYGGVSITDNHLTSSYPINLIDDQNGNLIDTAVNTGSMINPEDLDGYWGFNEKYAKLGKKIGPGYVTDTSFNSNNLLYNNITFNPGITTTGVAVSSSGVKASFDGTGFIVNKDVDTFNYDKDDDFAISLWIELPTNQTNITGSTNHIISKQGDQFQNYLDPKTKEISEYVVPYKGVRYPYSIEVFNQNSLGNDGRLVVRRADELKTSTIVGTTDLRGSQHHIVFQKTGSLLQLYVDGTLDGSTTDTSTTTTSNKAIQCIGSKGWNNGTGFSGSLDEVRFFNRGLTTSEITSLSDNDFLTGSAYNTNRVGNVFYQHGIITVTDPRPKYLGMLLGQTGNKDYGTDYGFNASVRGRHTIYEHEISCEIRGDEFNMTLNPTIRKDNHQNSELPKSMTSNDEWTPYITTIGIYDKYGRMLAVGKLAQPIPKRSDVDLTINVKYDM